MLGVMHGESNRSFCRVPSRLSDYHSTQRVQTYEELLGLETSPRLVSEDSQNILSDRSGSVCIQANIPGSTVLQLDTRPSGRSSRWLPTKMESVSGICKSTMGVNRSSTIRSSVPESQCSVDSSRMKNAGMVSNVVVTSGGVSVPSTSTQGGGVASAPSSSTLSGRQDSVGCMAYIREGCRKEELSINHYCFYQ